MTASASRIARYAIVVGAVAVVSVVAVVAVASCGAIVAQDRAPDRTASRDAAWRAFFAARSDEALAGAIDAVIATKPALADVIDGLERGDRWRPKIAAGRTGWRTLSIVGPDGATRPHLAWVPPSYDPAKPHALIVDLHGAVSRTTPMRDDYLKKLQHRVGKLAETHGTLLLIPKGQRGAEWWTPVGSGNVLAAIRRMKQDFHVDEDRVYCAGFSDGASGSFYLALHRATPFAGFIPLCGHVRVAQAGGAEVFLRNLRNRPLYVVNTGRDVLYPSAGVRPFIRAMKDAGVDVTFRSFDDMPHAPLFVPDERARIHAWMTAHPRRPAASDVWLETAAAPAVCDWIAVRALAAAGADDRALPPDLNPRATPRRLRLGIRPDPRHADLGVRVERVTDGSLAATLGLRAGDVIVQIDETPVADAAALSAVFNRKRAGQPIELGVYRGSELTSCIGVCPTPRPAPAFRRSGTRAMVSATREGNEITLRTSGVRTVEIRLHHGTFDLARPVVVHWNGKRVFARAIEPDLRYVLRRAGLDRDRRRIRLADVTLHRKP